MQNNTGNSVFLYNPTCEYAVANGNGTWQPNKILQKMENDLATLPLFFARPNDQVIVPELPSKSFLEQLKRIGVEPPDFILKQTIQQQNYTSKINELRPWGWSPAAHKLLDPLKQYCSEDFKNSPVFNWKPEYKHYYSKKFALGILKQIITRFPSEYFIEQNQIAEICTLQTEIEELLNIWGNVMVKAPWSSSGRGLQPITKTPVHPKVWERILGIVKEQGYAIVEPYLKKVIDLALQFHVKAGKVEFLGISNFSTDYKGQYNGNNLNGLPESLDRTIAEFVLSIPTFVLEPLLLLLEESDLAKNYEGYFGVDMLIFKDKKGRLKVNPCLEINVRHNMGLLSLQLKKLIEPTQKGLFRTFFNPGTSFYELIAEMKKKHPLQLKNNKIESGFLALTEAKSDTQFGAYILV
jgi:hypothetical protein